MDNYTILEKDPAVKKKLENTIQRIGLEQALHIFHPPGERQCGIEVTYSIKEGLTRGPWKGGTLEIYINEERPRIHCKALIDACYDIENTNNRFVNAIIDDVLIEVYADKALEKVNL